MWSRRPSARGIDKYARSSCSLPTSLVRFPNLLDRSLSLAVKSAILLCALSCAAEHGQRQERHRAAFPQTCLRASLTIAPHDAHSAGRREAPRRAGKSASHMNDMLYNLCAVRDGIAMDHFSEWQPHFLGERATYLNLREDSRGLTPGATGVLALLRVPVEGHEFLARRRICDGPDGLARLHFSRPQKGRAVLLLHSIFFDVAEGLAHLRDFLSDSTLSSTRASDWVYKVHPHDSHRPGPASRRSRPDSSGLPRSSGFPPRRPWRLPAAI